MCQCFLAPFFPLKVLAERASETPVFPIRIHCKDSWMRKDSRSAEDHVFSFCRQAYYCSMCSFFARVCSKVCLIQRADSLEFFADQAYLNLLGMDKLENLLRHRSVGVWFLDHFDKPLDANLPLFPPNIEAQKLA